MVAGALCSYVQASKRNRKFFAASPDAKLVFIVECTQRILAYSARVRAALPYFPHFSF